MYLRELMASCRRRWYLVVVLICVSGTVCWFAAATVGPSYDARATLVLIPPKSVTEPQTNRYLELGSLADTVDVVARSMTSEETVEYLKSVEGDAEYEVTNDLTTSAPLVLVATTGTDRAATQRLLEATVGQIPVNLQKLQEEIGTPARFQITAQPVAQDPEPVVSNKARVRLLAVLAMGLLFLSAISVAVVDGLLVRRARQRPQVRDRSGGLGVGGASGAREWPTGEQPVRPPGRGVKPLDHPAPDKPAKVPSRVPGGTRAERS